MLDPCEQAILEEEGSCPDVRMTCGGSERTRRNCRGGLELAAGSLPGWEFLVLCPSPPHSWSWEGNSAKGTPAAAGGAGPLPGRQRNLLSFNFCPELNQ